MAMRVGAIFIARGGDRLAGQCEGMKTGPVSRLGDAVALRAEAGDRRSVALTGP